MAGVTNELTDRLREVLRPSGPPYRLSWRGQLFDVLFAVVIFVPGLDYVRGDPAPHDPPSAIWLYTVVAFLSCALLTQRRRYPLAVLVAVVVLTMPVVGETPRITYYGCLIAAYSAAAYSRYRLPTMAIVVLLLVLAWEFTRDGMPTVPQQYVGSGVLGIVGLGGLALWMWRSRAEEGRHRLAETQRAREAELRRAVESERSRIARELHDVVTHNVSVMVIQAGAARRTLDPAAGQAREALLAVEHAGRTAMAELRHVMGLLASAGEDAALTPQPGLDQLEPLVDRVREAGLPVRLSVTGTPRPVPAGEALAAYRVVQEALTNAVRHAAGASATVSVHYADEELRVEVTDTGGRPTTPGGSGRGLMGLRERLAVYGGTLRAGPPLTGDGYRVDAVIPLAVP
jgi:signal transduction histidine kinase